MNAIVDAIRDAIDPAAPTVDRTGSRPPDFRPNTLYAWIEANGEAPDNGLQPRETFEIVLAYVADNRGEQARGRRDAAVTTTLDDKREAYLAWVRDHESTPAWDHIEATADDDFVRDFEGRAVAVRVSGYRFVI